MKRVLLSVIGLLLMIAGLHAQYVPGLNQPLFLANTTASSGVVACSISGGGNTVTQVGGKNLYTFVASGTLTCSTTRNMDYLVFAQGGGGAGVDNG